MNLGQFIEGSTDTWPEQFCSDAFWGYLFRRKHWVKWGHSQTNKDTTLLMALECSQMLGFLFMSWNSSAQIVKMEHKKLLQNELTPERGGLVGGLVGFCLAGEVRWNWTLHADQGDHIYTKPCTCTQKPFFIFIHIPQSSLLFDIYFACPVEEKYSSVSQYLCELG